MITIESITAIITVVAFGDGDLVRVFLVVCSVLTLLESSVIQEEVWEIFLLETSNKWTQFEVKLLLNVTEKNNKNNVSSYKHSHIRILIQIYVPEYIYISNPIN